MKRSDAIKFLKDTLDKVPARADGTHSDFDCDFILTELEKMGMKPPRVKLSTPLGARIFYEINDWEDNISIDEAGYELNDPDKPEELPRAKVVKI